MAILSLYWTIDAVFIFFSAFVAAYFYMTRNFGYWKNMGVMEIPPIPFVGNFGSCLLFKLAVFEYLQKLYERGKGLPYVGFYIFDKPALVLRDPDVIKNVLVKDFSYFCNRYVSCSESDVIGYSNLFTIKNPVWKNLRSKLTAVFSSAKIKNMYLLIDHVGDGMINYFDAQGLEGDGRVMELKEICAKYSTDIIGSCAFGLEVNSFKDPDAEFRKYGKMIFEFTLKRGFELMSHFYIPRLAEFRRTCIFEANASKFLRKAFNTTLNERINSGLKRNDLIDLLIDLKNKQEDNDDPDAFKFDDDRLVAQATIFFTAGFETSSTVFSFTLHELSLHPEIQTKLRDEIMTALEKNNGKLSYDVLQSLPYLDQVISESLRKYPSLPFLDRETISDYTVPKTGLVIKKGTPIYVSLVGLHYDPEYYPNPDHYDPERFNAENKRKLPPFAYLPFGDGPHNCIGLRFGILQIKSGLAKIISKYELIPCDETIDPVRFNPKSLTITSISGIHHRVRRIEKTGD